MNLQNITVDQLANIIRFVDGNNELGAGVLAERILEELENQNRLFNDVFLGDREFHDYDYDYEV